MNLGTNGCAAVDAVISLGAAQAFCFELYVLDSAEANVTKLELHCVSSEDG